MIAAKWRPDPVRIREELVETLDAIDAEDREYVVLVGDRITLSAYAVDRLLRSAREGTLVEEET